MIFAGVYIMRIFSGVYIMLIFAGVYGLECYKSQELYFELESARWNNVEHAESTVPESVCSKPCPMGQIKNFEVVKIFSTWQKIFATLQTACCWTCVACREDSIVAREDLCLKCPHGELRPETLNAHSLTTVEISCAVIVVFIVSIWIADMVSLRSLSIHYLYNLRLKCPHGELCLWWQHFSSSPHNATILPS